MSMADYFSKMNEFCGHGGLFLWQLRHFMNMRCLSNMVAMATFTRLLNKMSAKLIGMICYYASCMKEPSLNDSKRLRVLTLFTCILFNVLQNVVRSLLSAGAPYYDSPSFLAIKVMNYRAHLEKFRNIYELNGGFCEKLHCLSESSTSLGL